MSKAVAYLRNNFGIFAGQSLVGASGLTYGKGSPLECERDPNLLRPFFQQRENVGGTLAKYSPDKSGYKWIDADSKYLASLDPETDWEEMVKTFMNYHVNEFIANIIYSVTLFLVVMNPVGLSAIVHTNKIFNKKQQRFEDTRESFLSLFEFGPSSLIHSENMRLAKQHPGSWDHCDDFIEPCAVAAVQMHNMMCLAGLAGELYKGFFMEGGSFVPLERFPADFDACVKFNDDWSRRPWPQPSETARRAGKAFAEQFEEQWFPKPLRFVGRAVFCSLFSDEALGYFGLGSRNGVVMFLFKETLWLVSTIKALLPDPKVGLYEKNRMRREGLPLPQPSFRKYGVGAAWTAPVSIALYHLIKI
ncbi:uncharacterized protein EV420DRAFT_1473639 [Desarmillaria tabescens]|uniref:Uncharacterized protein n=1 Tax=Armillaria tabescens TaxID=1929756 RepID=A0AA39NLH5_ARMTA|nr:uncharacterized protein EV420DRAFT_1473639 [Desarmillaria tabescens]KAK0467811.1 hypothetical protein EV420DRAFT_1473639 [Desarmillaria tabescens]